MGRIAIDPTTPLGKTIIKYDKLVEKHHITPSQLEIIKKYTECSDSFLYTTMSNIKKKDEKKYKEFKKNFTGSKELISQHRLIALNNIINSFKVKDELVIFRGTSESKFRNVTYINGSGVSFIAPTSTSLELETAVDYISSKDPLIVEIHLPIKYSALWLRPFSLYPKECEFLLASNSNFEIENVCEEELPNKSSKKIVLKGILNK